MNQRVCKKIHTKLIAVFCARLQETLFILSGKNTPEAPRVCRRVGALPLKSAEVRRKLSLINHFQSDEPTGLQETLYETHCGLLRASAGNAIHSFR